MAKNSSLEEALARLSELRAKGSEAERAAELGRALGGKQSLLAARAATIVGDLKLRQFTSELAEAFGRFMVNPRSSDKGCFAKIAIAKTLYTLGADTQEVFLRGIRHVQMEPAFGGEVDTAPELRGTCSLGLVRMGYRDIMSELVELLMDPQMQARIFAARALAYAQREEGALLLRLKLLAGDREVDVMAECFGALLQLAPQASVAFVGRFLDEEDAALREAAALAIGASHRPAALALLRAQWERCVDLEGRRPLLLAIAMLRLPEAIQFLISLIETESHGVAEAAVEAMQMYRQDATVRARVEAGVAARAEKVLRETFRRVFGGA